MKGISTNLLASNTQLLGKQSASPKGQSSIDDKKDVAIAPQKDQSSKKQSFAEKLSAQKPKEKPNPKADAKPNEVQAQSSQKPEMQMSKPLDPGQKLTKVPVSDMTSQSQDDVSEVQLQGQLSEKASALADLNSAEKVVDSMSQREAMKSFIRRMQEKLNVQPEELIQAFSSMPVQDLMKPPESAMESFIDQLSLTDQQKPEARALFQKMLQETSSNSMAEYLKQNNTDLSVEVLSKSEIQKRQMKSDIGEMSSKFFPKAAATAATGEALNQASKADSASLATVDPKTASSTKGFSLEGFDFMSQPKPLAEVSPQAHMAKSNIQPNAQQAPQVEIANLVSRDEIQAAAKQGELDAMGLSLDPNMVPEDAVLPVNPQNAQVSQGLEKALKDLQGSVTGLSTSFNSPQEQGDGAMDGDTSSETADDFFASLQRGSGKTPEVKAGESFVVNPRPEATQTQKSENVNSLINNARMIAQKGGGEMKVQMTPEGLGQVDLKVKVNSGAVNVEMTAENNEVKKLIEKGLGDLKATLASQKLSVDEIKVDISQDMQNDKNSQQEQAEREMAQKFMQDFRRQNQSWRHGFMEPPGARAYASQVDPNTSLEETGKVKTNSSKRLDLVA